MTPGGDLLNHAPVRWFCQRVVALGLIGLQLAGIGHLAFELHGLNADGDVIELHQTLELHGHEERSLCVRAPREQGGSNDALCHFAANQSINTLEHVLAPERVVEPADVGSSSRAQPVERLWLMAPKASPPAAG